MFVLKDDLTELIREDNLNQLANPETINRRILKAEKEVRSYLRRLYDVEQIFRPIQIFDNSKEYTVGARVMWDVAKYDETLTYNTGDYTNYNDYIYKANQDDITGAFDSSKWDYIAPNKSLYVCVENSTGNYPDSSYFEQKDNRDELVMTWVTDIALYDLHAKVNPQQIPQFRIDRRDETISFLEKVADGTSIGLDLPIATTEEGEDQTINKWGSNNQKSWEI